MFQCPNRASVCNGTCDDCPKRNRRKLKFVFLDVDGVLNSRQYFRSDTYKVEQFNAGMTEEETDFSIGVGQLGAPHIERLNRLVQPGVVFILSSTWRVLYKLDLMQQMLEAKGFKGKLSGRTPSFNDGPRGREIAAWIEAELGIEIASGELAWPTFVIFDDDQDMDRLRGRYIQTTYEAGLQDEHVDRAIAMLGLGV
jgi:thiol-disulfide isomerase/thioredoxin